MDQVFVSHQKNELEFAQLVVANLKSQGYKPWLAEVELLIGMGWKKEIDEAIEGSIAMVVIMSADARKSEYVTYEWAYAMGRKKPVLCIVRGETQLHPKLDEIHHSDFTNPAHQDWERLYRSLKIHTDAALRSTSTPSGRSMRVFRPENDGLTTTPPSLDDAIPRSLLEGIDTSGEPADGDVFVVVDIQRDFFRGGVLEVVDAESLIDPLNKVIDAARNLDMQIVFTRDWHPEDHSSFKGSGGIWPPHCVQDSKGAKFHRRLKVPKGVDIVNIGVQASRPGYSPYEQPEMDNLINRPGVETVYVAGVALEYCVKLTCLDTLLRGKRVVACEQLIRSGRDDPNEREATWKQLERAGVIRSQGLNPFNDFTDASPKPWPKPPRIDPTAAEVSVDAVERNSVNPATTKATKKTKINGRPTAGTPRPKSNRKAR